MGRHMSRGVFVFFISINTAETRDGHSIIFWLCRSLSAPGTIYVQHFTLLFHMSCFEPIPLLCLPIPKPSSKDQAHQRAQYVPSNSSTRKKKRKTKSVKNSKAGQAQFMCLYPVPMTPKRNLCTRHCFFYMKTRGQFMCPVSLSCFPF